MRKHITNTATRYEYAIQNPNGARAFTLWFRQRRPTLNAIYRCIVENLDAIKAATESDELQWNGDGTITAGAYTGSMTGLTLLEARGRRE